MRIFTDWSQEQKEMTGPTIFIGSHKATDVVCSEFLDSIKYSGISADNVVNFIVSRHGGGIGSSSDLFAGKIPDRDRRFGKRSYCSACEWGESTQHGLGGEMRSYDFEGSTRKCSFSLSCKQSVNTVKELREKDSKLQASSEQY